MPVFSPRTRLWLLRWYDRVHSLRSIKSVGILTIAAACSLFLNSLAVLVLGSVFWPLELLTAIFFAALVAATCFLLLVMINYRAHVRATFYGQPEFPRAPKTPWHPSHAGPRPFTNGEPRD